MSDTTVVPLSSVASDSQGPVKIATAVANILQLLTTLISQQQSSGVTLLPAVQQLLGQLQKNGVPGAPTPSIDLTTLQQQLTNLPKNFITSTGSVPTQQPTVELQQLLTSISSILGAGVPPQQLGQVNGALGQTIGNLLDGKKTAIGVIGALLTSLLTQASAGSGPLATILTQVASVVPGLGGYAMPLFLALSAWGVLGKLEKWTQGTTPSSTSTK